jgi:hypothetical protein
MPCYLARPFLLRKFRKKVFAGLFYKKTAIFIYKNTYKPLRIVANNSSVQVTLDTVKKKVLAIIFKIMYNKSRK